MAIDCQSVDIGCLPVVVYSTTLRRLANVLTSAGTLVDTYSAANQGLIFSLVLVYYSILISYVYSCARWQGRTPPA